MFLTDAIDRKIDLVEFEIRMQKDNIKRLRLFSIIILSLTLFLFFTIYNGNKLGYFALGLNCMCLLLNFSEYRLSKIELKHLYRLLRVYKRTEKEIFSEIDNAVIKKE